MFDSCLSESIAGGVRGNFNDLLEVIQKIELTYAEERLKAEIVQEALQKKW